MRARNNCTGTPWLTVFGTEALPDRAGMPWEAFGLQLSLRPRAGMPGRGFGAPEGGCAS